MAATKTPASATAPLVALDSFIGKLDGRPVRFVRGDTVAADHPAVVRWPGLFGPQRIRHEVKS